MKTGSAFVCSWSGGKDSCLALHRARQAGGRPKALLTMMTEEGVRSRSHGLSLPILQAQSRALGIPLTARSASWNSYETAFVEALAHLRGKEIDTGVFGDIDTESHRRWEESVCAAAGIRAWLPLWRFPRRELLKEFFDLGFVAMIVAVKDGVLDRRLLGRTLDREVVAEIEAAGADASGERGEYHSVVLDGPGFVAPVRIAPGEVVLRDGYWFQDMALAAG